MKTIMNEKCVDGRTAFIRMTSR